jgi:hypothetical protein
MSPCGTCTLIRCLTAAVPDRRPQVPHRQVPGSCFLGATLVSWPPQRSCCCAARSFWAHDPCCSCKQPRQQQPCYAALVSGTGAWLSGMLTVWGLNTDTLRLSRQRFVQALNALLSGPCPLCNRWGITYPDVCKLLPLGGTSLSQRGLCCTSRLQICVVIFTSDTTAAPLHYQGGSDPVSSSSPALCQLHLSLSS